MDALIGSNSKNTAGDLYVAEKSYALFKPENLRTKRLQDVIASIVLIALLPLSLILVKNVGKHIANICAVLVGKKTWVGFKNEKNLKQFPHAKQGVLHPSIATAGIAFTEEDLSAIELNYARHYSAANDLSLLIRNYRKLGQ
jgi:lipopolysaccharide/colanic/teichoic acid biosynthesis glycosyltransferase